MRPGQQLRHVLGQDGLILTCGAYDALSCKIIEASGFPFAFTSGGSMTKSYLGLPDAEFLSLGDNVTLVRRMINATKIPVLADAEAGYGNAVNVVHVVREFESIGAAGVVIEDQSSPKRCPAYVEVPELISLEEAAGKIRAAVDARTDPSFVIVGRTDSIGADVTRRAAAYVNAGADAVLVIRRAFAPHDYRSMGEFVKSVGVPVMITMSGWHAELTRGQLSDIGVKVAIYPLLPLQAAASGIMSALKYISTHGELHGFAPMPISEEEMNEFVGLEWMLDLQERYTPSDTSQTRKAKLEETGTAKPW